MARADTVTANPLATRLFSPIVRDWQRPLDMLRIVLEAVLMVGVSVLLSKYFSPDDPFGVDRQFPWIWIVPTLLALRYGSIDGMLAAALVLVAWLLPEPWGMTGGAFEPEFPQEFFLGGLVVVLVAGQFADVWNSRLNKVRAANAYLEDRLTSLTRTHYLTRLSHQRLEQELLVRPVMLKDLLTELRPLSLEETDELVNADALMRVLVSTSELESADIYQVVNGEIDPKPVASVGEPHELDLNDPLVQVSLEERRFYHVRSAQATSYSSNYLACAPIISSSGHLLGITVVRTMPFFALNEENLQFIVVLLGYYADGLAKSKAIRPIIVLRPHAPPEFALEWVRMKRLYDSSRIESSLVGLVFPLEKNGHEHFEHMRRVKRSTDVAWEIETAESRVLMLLMPMAGSAAIEGMISRFERSFRSQFDSTMIEAGVKVVSASVSAAECEWTLDDLLNRCGVKAPTIEALTS
jgi:hypothetical protein